MTTVAMSAPGRSVAGEREFIDSPLHAGISKHQRQQFTLQPRAENWQQRRRNVTHHASIALTRVPSVSGTSRLLSGHRWR